MCKGTQDNLGSSKKEVNMSHGVYVCVCGVCGVYVCGMCVVGEDGTQGVTHAK